MKYIFLAYQDEEQWASLSDSERELIEEACLVHEQELRQNGYLFAVEDFHDNQTAITVQVVDGRVSLSDSMIAETKQRLIQLFFINARDLNEAIQLISKMPQTRKGPIEVRPIVLMPSSLACVTPSQQDNPSDQHPAYANGYNKKAKGCQGRDIEDNKRQ